MPATAKLIPKYRPRLDRLGKAAWELAIPPSLSDTGKEKRLFFPTKKAAALITLQLRNRQQNFGISLTALTPARIAEAAEAYNLLTPSGLRLLDVVRDAVVLHQRRTASIPFSQLCARYIESRTNCSPAYLGQLSATCARFPQLHNRLVCDITSEELKEILNPLTPASHNVIMTIFRAIFTYGREKLKVLSTDPFAQLDFIKITRKEVQVISNEHVAKMLEHALLEDLRLLPYLVLGFFCGIRPEGELTKLYWSDISLAERAITIRSEVSKTKRRRFPELSENAAQWLNAYAQRGGVMTGKIVTYAASALHVHRENNRIAAGLDKWVHQGMRHTFCSNWLAVHKDIGKLVLLSGHDSVDTMWRHYHRGVTETDAAQFWAIKPQTQTDNIIKFA